MKFLPTIFLLLFSILVLQNKCKAQSDIVLEPTVGFGKIFPNYTDYPKTTFNSSIGFNVEWQAMGRKEWNHFFNFPQYGINFAVNNFGNNKVFGSNLIVYPNVSFNLKRKTNWALDWNGGMGAAFFSKHFSKTNNLEDLAIGSSVTWNFNSYFIYRRKITDKMMMKFSFGFLHQSNGHTQIPNFGLNSLMGGVGLQFYKNGIQPFAEKQKVAKSKTLGLFISSGLAMHELGSAHYPIGGPKFGVQTFYIAPTITFKKYSTLRVGLGLQHYNSYEWFLNLHPDLQTMNIHQQASAVVLTVGNEFHLGQFSIDMELGANIYKPFFNKFFHTFESKGEFDYTLKRWISCRLGIEYYFLNRETHTTNFFIASHIKANFGQADFSEISCGVTHQFLPKAKSIIVK